MEEQKLTFEEFVNESIKIMLEQTNHIKDSKYNGLELNNIEVIKDEADEYYNLNCTPSEFIKQINEENN